MHPTRTVVGLEGGRLRARRRKALFAVRMAELGIAPAAAFEGNDGF
jgi:hypothetical protein